MHIEIQSPGLAITPALAGHTRRRLRFGLTRHTDRIQRVVVRLGDQNGPRGGVDKLCRVRVYLLDAPAAIISEIGTDMYAVIDRTVDRVTRAVVKHIDRSRDSRRRVRGDGLALSVNALDTPPPSSHTEGERA